MPLDRSGSIASMGPGRRGLFICGVLATASALGLVLVSYTRAVHTQDYLEQARAGVPWVRWGLLLSAMGFLLSLFGRRGWRSCVPV